MSPTHSSIPRLLPKAVPAPMGSCSRPGCKFPSAVPPCTHISCLCTLSLSQPAPTSPRFAPAPKSVDGHGFMAKPGAGRRPQPPQIPTDTIPQNSSGKTFQKSLPTSTWELNKPKGLRGENQPTVSDPKRLILKGQGSQRADPKGTEIPKG